MSLEQQSLENFAVIVVDDGSTDSSGEFAIQWAADDTRVVYLAQDNQGLSAARNCALDYLASGQANHPQGARFAQAPYLLFLDSDDMLEPFALEHLLHEATKNSLDILFYSGTSFFQTPNLRDAFKQYQDYYNRNSLHEGIEHGLDFAAAVISSGDFKPSVCMQLFRTAFLLENTLRFYPGIMHEDNLFTFSCLVFAQRVAYLDEKLYLRRIREGSITTKPKTHKNAEGYLRSGIEAAKIMAEIPQEQLTRQQTGAAAALINSFINNARDIYLNLGEDEQTRLIAQFAAEHSVFDHIIFEQTIHLPFLHFVDAAAPQAAAAVAALKAEYENSRSYRIGRALTKLPRAILGND